MDTADFPKRKSIRLEEYDYSSAGAYFITVCVANRLPLLWKDTEPLNVGADSIRPHTLSDNGNIVDVAINQISQHYPNIVVDKYCIMPDHIHMIVFILTDENGRQIAAPTISTVIGQMKRWVSKKIGFSIWQKSFIDRVIRNENGYRTVWEYIDNNPVKIDYANDQIDFTNMQGRLLPSFLLTGGYYPPLHSSIQDSPSSPHSKAILLWVEWDSTPVLPALKKGESGSLTPFDRKRLTLFGFAGILPPNKKFCNRKQRLLLRGNPFTTRNGAITLPIQGGYRSCPVPN